MAQGGKAPTDLACHLCIVPFLYLDAEPTPPYNIPHAAGHPQRRPAQLPSHYSAGILLKAQLCQAAQATFCLSNAGTAARAMHRRGTAAAAARAAAAAAALRCATGAGPHCLAARGQCPMARPTGPVPARRPCAARPCPGPWEAPEASQAEVGAPLFTQLHTQT